MDALGHKPGTEYMARWEAAATRIFETDAALFLGIALRLTRTREDAEDLHAEAGHQAARQAATEDVRSLPALYTRIAQCRLIDELRKREHDALYAPRATVRDEDDDVLGSIADGDDPFARILDDYADVAAVIEALISISRVTAAELSAWFDRWFADDEGTAIVADRAFNQRVHKSRAKFRNAIADQVRRDRDNGTTSLITETFGHLFR